MRNASHVQCELYRRLVNRGYDVIPEYRDRRNHIRADLAVVGQWGPLVLIEAKDTPHDHNRTESRQFRKYLATGIPFIYCDRMDEVDEVVEKVVTNILSKS